MESPEAGLPNEYSKFPHQRTQSMDSMSSGHSSGDQGPTSNNKNDKSSTNNTEPVGKRGTRTNKCPVVMPLEDASDQEETPAYLRFKKNLLNRTAMEMETFENLKNEDFKSYMVEFTLWSPCK